MLCYYIHPYPEFVVTHPARENLKEIWLYFLQPYGGRHAYHVTDAFKGNCKDNLLVRGEWEWYMEQVTSRAVLNFKDYDSTAVAKYVQDHGGPAVYQFRKTVPLSDPTHPLFGLSHVNS